MQFHYVHQYRDAAEALAHRFTGDPAPSAPVISSRAQLAGWVAVAACVVALYAVGNRAGGGAACAALRGTLAELDRSDHPVFVTGVLLCAIGAALILVPAAYLLARRRSTRATSDEAPVTVRLDDAGITLVTAAKELRVKWGGIIAVGETRSLLVLKTAGDLRLIIPRRAIPSAEALQQLREEFIRRVPPMASVAAVEPPARRAA